MKEQTMRELIYKDEAYKAIDNCIRDGWDRISPTDAKMNIHHLVSDANEADRPQGWIPCSERLPSKSGNYLVTIIQNESSFQQGVINVFIRSLAPANILYGEGFGKQMTWRQELWEDVVAWMPLPKSWKGIDNE